MVIKTRFAPSPTGYLHIGGARTALFCWAYARKFQGKFVLRIEDTDQARSSKSSIDAIIHGLDWLGLDYDEGPFFQSQRSSRYEEIISKLISDNQAYYCYCSSMELAEMRDAQVKRGEKPRYNGKCRPENAPSVRENSIKNNRPVVRFKNPDSDKVEWTDKIKGKISIKNSELDDFIIARSDGSPTYNFTVVVDDLDMNITHVIRGDDHINNTPRQINLILALNSSIPFYAHLPMIHGMDGQKLSKRHGSVSVMRYKEFGYLPSALKNYIARLGWGYENSEIFSMKDFINLFSLEGCTKSSARFDFEKLKWLNSLYLKNSPLEYLVSEVEARLKSRGVVLTSSPNIEKICDLLRERIQTIEDLVSSCEMFYIPIEKILDFDTVFKSTYFEKFNHVNPQVLKESLNEFVTSYPETDDEESIAVHIKKILSKHKLKMPEFAIPLRLILLGNSETPSIAKVLVLLGKMNVCNKVLKSLECEN